MIYLDIISSFEKALGTSLEPAQRRRAVEVMAADLGGERHYLPHLPKLRMHAQVASAGDVNAELVAKQLNVSSRYIRQVRKILCG